MKHLMFISVIVLCLVSLTLLVLSINYSEKQLTPEPDNVYIHGVDSTDYEILAKYLQFRDTVTYEFRNDLVTFIPIGKDEYKIISERAPYAIGIFSNEDAVQIFSWVYAYPLPNDYLEYPNLYYHEIVAEKIWE